MAKGTTPGDDHADETTPTQDDAWTERLRREDEDDDARATTELPAQAPGTPTAATTPIVAGDDQHTRELPSDGTSAFAAGSPGATDAASTTPRRRPSKRLLMGIGIAAAGLALVGTSTAVAVANAGGGTSASSSTDPGSGDGAGRGDGSAQGPGGRQSDSGDGATDYPSGVPTPPATGDESDGDATGPDGKALPEGGPADGPKGGPGGPGPGERGGPKHDAANGTDDSDGPGSSGSEDDSDRPTPPTDAPTPPTPDATPDAGSGSTT